jgi:hypothetical protein
MFVRQRNAAQGVPQYRLSISADDEYHYIYRVEDGKIAEEVYLGGRLGLWQQLRLVPESRKLAAEVGRGYCY